MSFVINATQNSPRAQPAWKVVTRAICPNKTSVLRQTPWPMLRLTATWSALTYDDMCPCQEMCSVISRGASCHVCTWSFVFRLSSSPESFMDITLSYPGRYSSGTSFSRARRLFELWLAGASPPCDESTRGPPMSFSSESYLKSSSAFRFPNMILFRFSPAAADASPYVL